jgi:hypothetical protein
VIGSLTLVLVTILTAFAVVREREIGTLEQIMVTPIRPSEFILGKTLPFFLIGLLDVSLIATVGTLWFRVPFRGNVLVLALGAVLFLLCMLSVGLLISTVSSTQQQAMVTSFFFIMPAITFSGFGFPIATMPQWLQYLTYLSPLRYFLVVLRGTYLKGVGLHVLWPQMAAMAGLGVGLLTSLPQGARLIHIRIPRYVWPTWQAPSGTGGTGSNFGIYTPSRAEKCLLTRKRKESKRNKAKVLLGCCGLRTLQTRRACRCCVGGK